MYFLSRTIPSIMLLCLGFSGFLFSHSAPQAYAQVPATADSQQDAPSTAKALDLLRARKYELASAEYQRIIDAGANASAGYAGLARVYLRQERVDEALKAALKAVELGTKLAVPHVVLGEVYFRQGKIEEAAEEFRRLILLNTSDPRAYYGLYRVMLISSDYHKAKLLLDRAYKLDSSDPDILRAWSSYLPVKDRIQALEDGLKLEIGDQEYREKQEHQLAALKAFAASQKRACSLSSAITSTETPLMPIMVDAKRARGYGLPVKFNGAASTLLLDTGASGFSISPRLAEKAGIQKAADTYYFGFGDQGEQKGYTGYVETIQVGNLLFKDCYVEVLNKPLSANEDGLLGVDVFSQFLVELNFPDQKLALSKLPDDPARPATVLGLETQTDTETRFHDRYVAPEMRTFFPIYRVGHNLMIPAKLNGQGPALLVLDTGSADDLLHLESARLVSKISSPGTFTLRGVSGEVSKVLRAQDVTIQIPGFTQKLYTVLVIDLASFGKGIGIQTSGFLGFETLHMLDIKIDYRDGLLQFNFDPKRFW